MRKKESGPQWGRSLDDYLFNYTHDCVVLLDKNFTFIRVNKAYANACGRSCDEFPGRNHFELYPSSLIDDFKKVVDSGIPYCSYARPFVFPDYPEWGVTYWDLSLVAIPAEDGNVEVLLFILRDVTAKQRALRRLEQTNRALRVGRECRALIVHAETESALLDGMCRLIVKSGGYLMAWVGVGDDDDNRTVRPITKFGHEDRYLSDVHISWDDNELGRGPTGTAIRTRQTQVNSNWYAPRMQVWREDALKRGYRSNIALPLVWAEQLFGVLTIYASETEAFSVEEVKLLEELVSDVSLGINGLRTAASKIQAEEKFQESEQRYRKLFDEGFEAVALADAETGVILEINHAMEKLMGYDRSALVGQPQKILHPPETGQRKVSSSFERHRSNKSGELIETEIMTKEGEVRAVEIGASSVSLNGRLAVIGFFRDISDRKNYQAQLEYQATHDELTGLANRNLLTDRIEMSVAHTRRIERHVAVILLDLDRFKFVNDTLGHVAGDALLRGVAQRVSGRVRPGDTVARLGGDELMVVLSELSGEDDAAVFARELLGILAQPMFIDGSEVVVTASIGISMCPRDGQDASTLYKAADIAMYRAKEGGGNKLQFYAPEMNIRTLQRFELENGLRHAIERGELELYYQPKVSLRHGHVVGSEALIRWNHPALGVISPAEFIPLAEETGLIVPIGEWVMSVACQQISKWNNLGMAGLTVSVNLSARQLREKNLPGIIKQIINTTGIDARHLEFEITESAAMTNPEMCAAILNEIKALGIRISLDDFGTGYSSLAYLKRLPIDALKIDRSFVRDITTDPEDAAVVKTIVALAHSLGVDVIAEGVETAAQLKFLQRAQCDEMQGYFFSKPLPLQEFCRLLKEQRQVDMEEPAHENGRTLLLVEDEQDVQASLKRVFHYEKYRILSASNAEEGLALLALHPVQVIICDQRMPGMSGTEFLSRVWQMYPDTIRILLTGYTDIRSVTEAVNKGAILKFLTKPWENDQLLDHVREAFRYHDSRNAALLTE